MINEVELVEYVFGLVCFGLFVEVFEFYFEFVDFFEFFYCFVEKMFG